jgi:iron complex outermembrane receptor protein
MFQTAPWRPARRSALFGGFALSALIAAAPAVGQTLHAIHVPAGPLDAALMALAAQSHEQLLYTPGLVAGRTAPAVDGELTAEQALVRMLGASGITVNRTGPSMLVLRPAPPRSPTPVAGRGGTTASDVGSDRPFVADRQEARIGPLPATGGETPAPRLANTVEEVEVTGTHIRGGQTASPVLVVSHADLERSGQTTVADALRALPENFGGGASEGAVNTGADKLARNGVFGSALNLRGLGNNATLVLIDGRRVAGSGTFGDFVDISTIPTSAVERVDVLLDGASALYGSDAVGGVVNIIMRKDLDGAETRILGGVATSGQPAQGQISQSFGKQWTTGGLVFTYELQQRNHLSGADRPFAASADLRPLGGSDLRSFSSFPGNILGVDPVTRALAPSFAIPAGQTGVGLLPGQLVAGTVNLQNQRAGEDILPDQTLNSVYLHGHQDLGARLQISGDARYSDRRFKSIQAPAISTLTVNRGNPFFVSPTGATSETIAYSFAGDLPNPVNFGSTKTLGLSLDAKLKMFGDWQSEGYITFAQEREVSDNSNLINSIALNEALGTTADRADTPFSPTVSGFFNPFTGIAGSNKPAVTAYIGSGFLNLHSRDQVWSVNLQADGALWTLPAGAVKLALGAQARREALLRTGSIFVAFVAPTPQAVTDVSRDVTAVFAEAQVPLFGPQNARPGLQRLELSLAGRIEHYEAVGSTSNPKIGILWAPSADVQLHATYGASFRAPALRETSDPASFSPQMLNLGAGKVQVLTLSGGNPNLVPETATSWTYGVDWRPSRWPALVARLNGFDIQYRNRIDRPVSANLANALQDPTLARFVTRISPTTNPADLALIKALLASPALNTLSGVFPPEAFGAVVDNRYVNTSKLHVQGLDFTGGYGFDVGGDRVSLAANATYMFTYDLQSTPVSPRINRVNTVNFPERFHSRITADWTRDRLTLGGAFNYAGAYRDALGVRIGDQPTVDLQARLAPAQSGPLRGVSILLNVRNVFDRDPPFYNNPVGIGFDAANADPVGRFVALQLTRAW